MENLRFTRKFVIETTAEQRKLLTDWSRWTKAALNYLAKAEGGVIHKHLKNDMYKTYLGEDSPKDIVKRLNIPVKRHHLLGIQSKLIASIKVPTYRSPFITAVTQESKIEQRGADFYLLVKHPIKDSENVWLEFLIRSTDRNGRDRSNELTPLIGKDFAYELHFSRRAHRWILSLIYNETCVDSVAPSAVMGIDLGIRNIAWAVVRPLNDPGRVIWSRRWSIGQVREMGRVLRRRHRDIRTDGKRAKLPTLSGLRKNLYQTIAHTMVQKAKELNAVIVLEELHPAEMMRKKEPGQGDKMERGFRRALSGAAMDELSALIEHKAQMIGNDGLPSVMVEYVSPSWTSRTCPKCGTRETGNGSGHGIIFKCQHCKYENNYDFIAPWNIAGRSKFMA